MKPMTKEELYKRLFGVDKTYSYAFKILDEFFSQNVCIPKGENRHKYADVLHEIAENTDLILEFKLPNRWNSVGIEKDDEYRIKPPEPIYEWQWYYYPCFGNGNTGVTEYMTDEVFEVCQKSRGLNYDKIEKSKRVLT